MKVYELKRYEPSQFNTLAVLNAMTLYEINKDLFEAIRRGDNVAFKYKEDLFKIVKGIRTYTHCEKCQFKKDKETPYCEELGLCLQQYVRNLENEKNLYLDIEIRKAEEYEVTFMED